MSTIIVDTREQLPLYKVGIKKQKLDVGDYSTMILRHSFCIERKSPMDLYGSLIGGHERFMNEVYRAERHGIKLVIYVECSYDCFVSMKWRGASYLRMRPETLKKIVDSTFRRREKNGLTVVWCSSRECMKRKIKERLLLEEKTFISI